MSDTIFHDQVIAILPKLRVQALALTRHRASAEDLVQDAVCNALAAQESFIPGTNFAAWMHRILRNRFISNLRKRRDTTDIEDVPATALATDAPHEDRLALKELATAMDRLPSDQREALVMVVVHGMSYEDLAESTGCAVGTAKSRVFRARRQLEAWLMGEGDHRIAVRPEVRPGETRSIQSARTTSTQAGSTQAGSARAGSSVAAAPNAALALLARRMSGEAVRHASVLAN